MSDYRYDVFLSYRRAPASRAWVKQSLLPLLEAWLFEHLGRAPVIFLDEHSIDPGTRWPEELERALHDSKCLLAVLSCPYVHSDWCLSEWNTMEAREQLFSPAHRLIIPLRFRDGDSFRPTRQRIDMEPYAHTAAAFVGSREFMEFERTIRDIVAPTVFEVHQQAPPWQPNWPIVRCKAPPPPSMLQRLK